MYKKDKDWEFLPIDELPLITQNNNRLKAVIISIDQIKSLLTKIQKMENELAYYRQKAFDRDNFSRKTKSANSFIPWEEENFNQFEKLKSIYVNGRRRFILWEKKGRR
ncbi:hypothetical protein J7K55_05190 [Candidatus Aerophobetes bacterium]|nr:hypothetical protein [Candidatus Aerophobetes bacterium]